MKKYLIIFLLVLVSFSEARIITIDKTTKQILRCDDGVLTLRKGEEHFDFKGILPQFSNPEINIADYKVINEYTLQYSSSTNMERVKKDLVKKKENELDTELAKETPDVIKALRLFRELEILKKIKEE